MTKFNHAFDIAFEVKHSTDIEGYDVTPEQMRKAIQTRLDGMSDDEMLEAVGAPFDTYEE